MRRNGKPPHTCVCVRLPFANLRLGNSRNTKPQDGGVCMAEHTSAVAVVVAVVAVVVVVVGTNLVPNYQTKPGLVPVWYQSQRCDNG